MQASPHSWVLIFSLRIIEKLGEFLGVFENHCKEKKERYYAVQRDKKETAQRPQLWTGLGGGMPAREGGGWFWSRGPPSQSEE